MEIEIPKNRITQSEGGAEMTTDYKSELAKLEAYVPSEQGSFWSPKDGQYKVKGLSEIDEAKPFKDKPNEPRKGLKILVNDEHKLWTFAVGKSTASTYGQLIRLAAARGQLTGTEFTVVVNHDCDVIIFVDKRAKPPIFLFFWWSFGKSPNLNELQ